MWSTEMLAVRLEQVQHTVLVAVGGEVLPKYFSALTSPTAYSADQPIMNQPVIFQVNGTFMGLPLSLPPRYGIHYGSGFRQDPRTVWGPWTTSRAIRLLKARYCRFLDTRDIDSWRQLFASDASWCCSTSRSRPAVPTRRRCHRWWAWRRSSRWCSVASPAPPPCTTAHAGDQTASPVTATGIWAMEDLLVFPDGSRLHGAGHYHEEYEKREGRWQITRLHLTRTLMDFTAAK